MRKKVEIIGFTLDDISGWWLMSDGSKLSITSEAANRLHRIICTVRMEEKTPHISEALSYIVARLKLQCAEALYRIAKKLG